MVTALAWSACQSSGTAARCRSARTAIHCHSFVLNGWTFLKKYKIKANNYMKISDGQTNIYLLVSFSLNGRIKGKTQRLSLKSKYKARQK